MLRCEYSSRIVLPAIRRAMALEMRRRGLSVSQIAELLETTPASVSLYLRGRRGRKVDVPRERIVAIVDKLLRGEDVSQDLCDLCRQISASSTGRSP